MFLNSVYVDIETPNSCEDYLKLKLKKEKENLLLLESIKGIWDELVQIIKL